MRQKLPIFIRHRLDITVRDLLFGLGACIRPESREDTARGPARATDWDVLRACSSGESGLVCLSVRTGFDLLLRALDWPAGSEVILSAITQPDMARIVQAHGLNPVPVDLDPQTLEPSQTSLERALTPRTKAVLVAHLFGGKMDLKPVSDFTEKHGLLLLEDCAQAFEGPPIRDTPSDVSMYSFGPLKTATALGGAVFCIKDTQLLERMRRIERRYPSQGRGEYAAKLLEYLALKLISRPVPYGLLVRATRRLGVDLDSVVGGMGRSFPTGPRRDFFRCLRRRPSAPLLALLGRRLRRFDYGRLARRASAGERVSRLLGPRVTVPGSRSRGRTFWVFPVVAPRPEALVRALRDNGFDASYATSNLAALKAPPGRPFPHEAARTMSNVVYVPAYPELRGKYLDRLAEIVAATLSGGR